MPATVTLSSTTLLPQVGASDNLLTLTSTSGIYPGMRLFIDQELMGVTGFGVGTQVTVTRGLEGTSGAIHNSGAIVWIGTPEQFYSRDPVGRPPIATPVAPWINVRNGNVWFAQGDATPIGAATRWWQLATSTYENLPFGPTVITTSPTAST
jgi:hypothetical protein